MFGVLLELEVKQLLHYFCFFIESLKPDLSLLFFFVVLLKLLCSVYWGGWGRGCFIISTYFIVCVSVWSIKAILLIVKIIKGKETVIITTVITL